MKCGAVNDLDRNPPSLTTIGGTNTIMFAMTSVVAVPCKKCNGMNEIEVDFEKFIAWRSGKMLIQEALPELDADQRELLISGICPKCWDEMFPPEEG